MRPYHDDSTASRLLSEVKHRRVGLVLWWGTTLEYSMLHSQSSYFFVILFDLGAVDDNVCLTVFSRVRNAVPNMTNLLRPRPFC